MNHGPDAYSPLHRHQIDAFRPPILQPSAESREHPPQTTHLPAIEARACHLTCEDSILLNFRFSSIREKLNSSLRLSRETEAVGEVEDWAKDR